MQKVHAIILAAGFSKRFDFDIPKQFMQLDNRMVVEHSLERFESCPLINDIILVCHEKYQASLAKSIAIHADIIHVQTDGQNKADQGTTKSRSEAYFQYVAATRRGSNEGMQNYVRLYKKISKIVVGGRTRQESSRIGTNEIDCDDDIVLIHDGARPFISHDIIQKVISALGQYDAVCTAIPSSDTVLRVNNKMVICEIPDRKWMLNAQTPQGFRVGLIKRAHEMARIDNLSDITDDCSLVVKYKLSEVFVIEGERSNRKITYREDLPEVD